MSRRQRSSLALLAAAATAAGIVGCTSVDSPSAPRSTPRAAVAAAADASGAIIVRDRVYTLFFSLDAEHGLLSIHLPVDDLWLCGGGSFPDIADRQRVYTPSDIGQFLVQVKDDESTVGVFRATSYDEAGLGAGIDVARLCAFIGGGAKVASGTVRHVQNLSNASFAAHWGGRLTTPAGDEIGYSETYQLTADAHAPSDATQWRVEVARIELTR
jgi:hypothetical protein